MRSDKPVIRTIVVEILDGNCINLREGDRSTGDLCWDEALGSLAELTHPRIGTCRYGMKTDAEHEAQAAKWRTPRPNNLIDGRLPAPEVATLLPPPGTVVDAEVPSAPSIEVIVISADDEPRCPF